MAYDELMRLSGSTNNALETVTTTHNDTGVYLGANRLFIVELRIASVTGTNPTLDVVIQEATTVGGSYTTIGTFAQQTAATGSEASGDDAVRLAVRTSKPYVRAGFTIGGSASPTFTGTTVLATVPAGGVSAY